MTGRDIRVLDEQIANKIAAGEVIERPASVVKELVENALDAGATRIEIEIREGGKEYIRVTDDGAGIPADQVPLAFARHATSKIRSADDLFSVHTLGFRGEALPSIASVAQVEMRTRTAGAAGGVRYTVEAGRPGSLEPAGTPPGTTVVVRRLFFNTPARYKFLRSEAAERRRVAEVAARIALAWPAVAFRFLADGRQVFATPGDGDLAGAVLAIYGQAAGPGLVPVDYELDGLRVHGFVGRPDAVHGNRDRMSVFLNGRWIHSAALLRAIEQGYETLLPPRRYPLAVLHLTVDPAAVDVNVHPAKAEVRFKDERAVFRTVLRAVRHGLLGAGLVGAASLGRPVEGRAAPAPATRGGQSGLYPGFERPEPPSGPASGEARRPAGDHAEEPVYAPRGSRESAGTWRGSSGGAARERLHRDAYPELGTGAAAGGPARDARTLLREMNVLGQLHRTFILGETPQGLWIIDQHVAHERVLYERFLRRAARGGGSVQHLLAPVAVTFSPERSGLAEQYQEELARLGFVLEPFGGASYLVRGVPVELGPGADAARLTGVLEEVLDACDGEGGFSAHEAAASLACRAAVKAGQVLDMSRMKKLLAQLAEADNPFACPHGRPVIIELDRMDLERRFGRR